MFKRPTLPLTRLLVLLPLLCGVALVRGQDSTPEAEASTEAIGPDTVTQYGLLTLRPDVDPDLYNNPFDPNDIEIVAILESPSGREFVIPGFWLRPYADVCNVPCIQENLQPQGAPEWQVRFAPDEVGTWTYSLQIRDNGSLVTTLQGQFDVEPSERTGFVDVAPNRRYFQVTEGQPYFPIGHNLHWSWQGTGGWHAYDRWFEALAAAGGNYARVYIDVPWFVGLEWEVPGNYSSSQAAAYRLDRILELAAHHGIRLQLVVLWSQALRTYSGPPVLVPEEPPRPDTSADWDNNPYNVANGGFLNGPSQFFSNELAQSLFRRRLRYIAARWGYSPDIFAWELTDEIDMVTSNNDLLVPWIQDMASYLRQIDQNRHLITVGSRNANDRLNQLPLLDFTQARLYQSLPIESTFEQESTVVSTLRRALRLNSVPTMLTAYSLNPWYEPTASDPAGVHFQNTLWASVLAGAGGGAVSDWGITYVIPQRLQRFYPPLAAYAEGVEWQSLDFQPAEAVLLGDAATEYGSVRVSGFERQFRTPPGPAVTRTISADGVYPGIAGVTGYLYGRTYNADFAQSHRYRVSVPVSTYLEVGVRLVSDQAPARLSVTVDDGTPVEISLAPSTRNISLRVPLPVGEHVVTLENSGDDWLELDYLQVDQIVAPARVLTLRDNQRGVALAWLQHRDYTWDKVAAGVEPEPLTLVYRLDQMPPGRYLTELWDTLSGEVLGEEVVHVGSDGVLRFNLLRLQRQLAIRAFRQEDGPTTPTPTASPLPTATPEPTATVPPTATPVPLEPDDQPLILPADPGDFQALLEQLPDPDTPTPTLTPARN